MNGNEPTKEQPQEKQLQSGTRVRVVRGYFTGQKGRIRKYMTEGDLAGLYIVDYDDSTSYYYSADELEVL